MSKKAKPTRKPNFPLVFWDGLKERAQEAANDVTGGNLTTYVNTCVNEAVKAWERKRK